jgi:GAF domain-containing protein
MAFALQLHDSLRLRESQVPSEFENGDALGLILTRYLLSVESEADSYILTSILLLDGTHLRHGAAPTLPAAYCAAIDGAEIGPCAGSCGTAAFRARPIYVTDIATDPLWADFRDFALPHGLRACWSTPIFDDQKAVLGTFAIYHLTARGPTKDEIAAIETITDHVSRAITWSRDGQDMAAPA